MDYKHFIGIDVSKQWLDYALVEQNKINFHQQTENTRSGIQSFIKQLKKDRDFDWKTTIFCMEYTGIYNNHLLDFLFKKKANIWLESGVQIKRSSGMQRGKNDKVDAERIALYAYKNREEVKLWQPKREVIEQLKHFTVLRNRIINVAKQLKTPLKEAGEFENKKSKSKVAQLCQRTIKALDKDLENIDKEIQLVVKSDPELNRLYKIITSITGIGPVTATQVILCTNEFKDIDSAKKFACYCGVAPFEHQSGTSIRGKTRVSKMGNKTMKTVLHMAALSSVLSNQDMKNYFERKVSEGKNKMAVLNAIRNKLVHRIFACVKQNKIYEKNYRNLLA